MIDHQLPVGSEVFVIDTQVPERVLRQQWRASLRCVIIGRSLIFRRTGLEQSQTLGLLIKNLILETWTESPDRSSKGSVRSKATELAREMPRFPSSSSPVMSTRKERSADDGNAVFNMATISAARPTEDAFVGGQSPPQPAPYSAPSRAKLPPRKDLQQTPGSDNDKIDASLAMDLADVQRELQKMGAASHQMMLARMTEQWSGSLEGLFFEEHEMEKKRWMLTALHGLNSPPGDDSTRGRNSAPRPTMMLALFEPKATASYLAGLHPKVPITHMAPSPLSHILFRNIIPLTCPVLSSETLVLPRESFSSAYCHGMASLVQAPEIPLLLRKIHECLVPKGVFHLILLDPMPIASTLGPRMRDWLDNNVMLNVGTKFRCANPSKLFPTWLTEAKLRGDGSVITKVRFRAVPTTSDSTSTRNEKSIKMELRAAVGRMLWQEIWGGFVKNDTWWWDVPECVEECVQLGTRWEYSMIEAVKDGNH
ncbi:hypothetical protein P8C59_006644 [Phyllachora maydis]|uniref:Uncharacterized protein n=1 Tax=Phyllachora maydis TaxID=1825666 RepID=A0AAD9I7X5_9PEZI|nr:hypothetical protein P8C59_006644 [Phyllachora maydis]